MPPELPAFDVTADAARNNPQAYYACRSQLISSTIESSFAKAGLYQLQDQLDAQRATIVSPMHNLAAIMETLEAKLSSLAEVLAHWQALLDLELPQENPDARASHARIDIILAAVANVRARVGDTALR